MLTTSRTPCCYAVSITIPQPLIDVPLPWQCSHPITTQDISPSLQKMHVNQHQPKATASALYISLLRKLQGLSAPILCAPFMPTARRPRPSPHTQGLRTLPQGPRCSPANGHGHAQPLVPNGIPLGTTWQLQKTQCHSSGVDPGNEKLAGWVRRSFQLVIHRHGTKI